MPVGEATDIKDFVFLCIWHYPVTSTMNGKFLVISKSTELLRVPIDCLMYIESDGNYSYVVTRDGRRSLVATQLGQIEDSLAEQLGEDTASSIVRLGRSLIINCKYVNIIDITKQKLVLSDCTGSWHELSASRVVLTQLKTLIENYDK